MERIENLKKNDEFKRIVQQLAEYLWNNKHLMLYGMTDYEKCLLLADEVMDEALKVCHSKFLVELRIKRQRK